MPPDQAAVYQLGSWAMIMIVGMGMVYILTQVTTCSIGHYSTIRHQALTSHAKTRPLGSLPGASQVYF